LKDWCVVGYDRKLAVMVSENVAISRVPLLGIPGNVSPLYFEEFLSF